MFSTEGTAYAKTWLLGSSESLGSLRPERELGSKGRRVTGTVPVLARSLAIILGTGKH